MTLSVAIICKNNDSTIGRTLDSVADLADEIIAVDSGSTDRTLPMLESAGARIIHSEWKGFVGTKRIALDACTHPWALCLDSDESPDETLKAAIRELVAQPGDFTCARMNRKVFYQGKPLNHAWQPEWRLRLIRTGLYRWTGLDPHDYLESFEFGPRPPGRVMATLPGTLRHDSISTFPDFRRKQIGHARTMARSMFEQGRRGSRLRLLTSPPGTFFKQLVLKLAFLDGLPGIQAAYSAAFGTAMKHAALLELSRHPTPISKPGPTADR